jgi:hypothetical protein
MDKETNVNVRKGRADGSTFYDICCQQLSLNHIRKYYYLINSSSALLYLHNEEGMFEEMRHSKRKITNASILNVGA